MTDMSVPGALNERGDAMCMRTMPGLNFGDVIKGLADGKKFARRNWENGRYIVQVLMGGEDIYVAKGDSDIPWAFYASVKEMHATDWIEVIA